MTDAPDLDEFFEGGLCGFVITGADGRIIRVNQILTNWLGLPASDVIGHRLSDFMPVAGKIYLETNLMPQLHGSGHFDEVALELVDLDGKRLPVLINGRDTVDAGGVLQSTAFIIVKFEQRLRYEKHILAVRNELQSANLTLLNRIRNEVSTRQTTEGMYSSERETAVLRERFIAALGHDLRNPLAALAGGLGLLKRRNLDAKAASYVGMMTESVDRMKAMVANLMDFAHARLSDGIRFDRDPVDLAPWISLAVRELQAAYPDRTIDVVTMLNDSVDCDPVRITQLLSNLLGNAITHGDPDGEIRIDATVTTGNLIVSVRNTGPTIPPDMIEHLFEPFVRVNGAPDTTGLGLGLYISAEIAKGHDGTLTAVSTDGVTTFTLTMPQRAAGAIG